jgi:cytochrome c peroxidase
MKFRFLLLALIGLFQAAFAALPVAARAGACRDPIDAPAEVQLGDRLFRETRFAQFFFANSNGDVNAKLRTGDPVMKREQRFSGKSLPDPFHNQSMNCRQCHLGNDLDHLSRLDGRTYCDFNRRSPIPARNDGLSITPRNSQQLVSVSLPRDVPAIFHFDGEFASIEDLTIGTLTGRNLGWLPDEAATAAAHIANVIRNDDGKNKLARRYGCGGFPYRVVMLGTDPRLPTTLRLPPQYRIDVTTASDDQVLHEVAILIHAYMDSLRFTMDQPLSPYDVFLQKNGLPAGPNQGESDAAYAQRLFGLIQGLSNPVFVTPHDGHFRFHKQRFQFGPAELQGLTIFFTEPSGSNQQHAGNCIACHTPPNFTDNVFHNNGASQIEYDGIFGSGSFAALNVPDLSTRNGNYDAYLPPTPQHPNASGTFRSPPDASMPGRTDLGVWNIFANPDFPNPQSPLTQILCGELNLSQSNCTQDAVLPMTIAFFKTPSVRDLGQSSPYMHSGAMDTEQDVINFYVTVSGMARASEIRNASPELSNVLIDQSDVAPLSAFLDSLNEDYH